MGLDHAPPTISNENPRYAENARRQTVRVGVVTIFPDLMRAALAEGVVGRAMRSHVELCLVSPRDFADDERRTVDDSPFGGGPGMVMMREPMQRAVAEARRQVRPDAQADAQTDAKTNAKADAPVILLTPEGQRFDQNVARELAAMESFVLVAGRYEGIDQRFVDHEVDRALSIGDYVLSGGEFAALVVLDAVLRLVPGTLGNPESTHVESFMDGLLDHPHYTRPADDAVPAVLRSGHHAAIDEWRRAAALEHTWRHRPDLLLDRPLSRQDRELLAEVFAGMFAEKAPAAGEPVPADTGH